MYSIRLVLCPKCWEKFKAAIEHWSDSDSIPGDWDDNPEGVECDACGASLDDEESDRG